MGRDRVNASGSIICEGQVPEKKLRITFLCESCDGKISVLLTHVGKKGKCPKCKHAIIVPAEHDLTLLDDPVPEEYKIQNLPPSPARAPEEVIERESEEESNAENCESGTGRRLPWIIDSFLYPTSVSGLIHLGIFTIIPLLSSVLGILLPPFGALGFIANLAISLYLWWFVTECVRDSAKGGTRVPEAFATADLGEMWSQTQHIIGCYLIFAGPVGFYYMFTDRTDIVFWLLLGYGVLFLPMGLLACIIFDSISGLNPVLLIGSIFSTFFQYCALVFLIGGVVLIFGAMTIMETDQAQSASFPALILGAVLNSLLLYAVFIVAHLLGRFYWRHQEKLNW